MRKHKDEKKSLSLNDDMLNKLRSKKEELKKHEDERLENERQQRIQQRKEREANKSFEELLEESELDWENFKK
ncbi:YqkE family protein [Halobacillus sp. A1]|uniref:YqkE family protein n=1 Tax=Halobacillus sp. A1 TaxID=2880262 RepID=UPI0020A63088|nr:YqkE family protein [Halobacillus sp. A1]MCP3032642.1 YqkE family protein [Halobacillus sp. A1]